MLKRKISEMNADKFKYSRRNSQEYYMYDDQKEEALLNLWKDKKKHIITKQEQMNDLNYLLDRFYSWKDSFYKPLRFGSVSGSIFMLMCVSFATSILK